MYEMLLNTWGARKQGCLWIISEFDNSVNDNIIDSTQEHSVELIEIT
jgi:hypothetical protein